MQWYCGIVVIITGTLHSSRPQLRIYAGLNPACSVCRRFAVMRISDNGPGCKEG